MQRGSAGTRSVRPSFAQSPAHLYDSFLHAYSRNDRKHHGVFFTPQPIAEYIVRRIDHSLREDFHFADGLAQSQIPNPQSQILLLDPACGTSVFLLAALDFLHARLAENWNDFVPELLPRLIGIEILPAAALLAKLNITLQLAATGYDFRHNIPIQIHCGDALNPNLQFAIRNSQSAIPIVLGNPPFSSLSTNTNPWIARLVRGDGQTRGYVQAGELRLGERKTWLHDDYVKFIRLAQWHVEQAGRGIMAFVTNRGYLDNATFRLMRQELLRVFPRIEILDLHGSRKADEVAPDGGRDENVFGLDQGVAVGVFSRPPARTRCVSGLSDARVQYTELWGPREDKLAALASGGCEPSDGASPQYRVGCVEEHREAHASRLPAPPDFRFTPAQPRVCYPEYDQGWSLAEAMPLNATAPVTARDHFVVAHSEEELRRRIAEFRDLTIPDDVIRRRYFQRTRSARYETGDTRGWKLAAARHAVAADADWQYKIVRCLYRPFDWRFVFWHAAMIDWPREEVTLHLVDKSCALHERRRDGETERQSEEHVSLCPSFSPSRRLCLLARRQQPPLQPCTYFWIADGLALDGVIRSDNRGSESLFPLYVCEDGVRRANFAAAFVAAVEQRLRLAWLTLGRGDLQSTFGPEDLLAYIYAMFHTPTYRRRYAAALKAGFPRVVLPRDAEQYAQLSRFGEELIALHLLGGAGERHRGRALQRGELPPKVRDFRAGGYVALRKWLQPAARSEADPQYAQIVAAIERTLELMAEVDRVYSSSAGSLASLS